MFGGFQKVVTVIMINFTTANNFCFDKYPGCSNLP